MFNYFCETRNNLGLHILKLQNDYDTKEKIQGKHKVFQYCEGLYNIFNYNTDNVPSAVSLNPLICCSMWWMNWRRMLFHCRHSRQKGPWGLKCGLNQSVFWWCYESDLDVIWMIALPLLHAGAALCKSESCATGTVTLWKSKDKRWAEKCQTSRTERARQHWEAFQWCSAFPDNKKNERLSVASMRPNQRFNCVLVLWALWLEFLSNLCASQNCTLSLFIFSI